jgi:hypothetical protein
MLSLSNYPGQDMDVGPRNVEQECYLFKHGVKYPEEGEILPLK